MMRCRVKGRASGREWSRTNTARCLVRDIQSAAAALCLFDAVSLSLPREDACRTITSSLSFNRRPCSAFCVPCSVAFHACTFVRRPRSILSLSLSTLPPHALSRSLSLFTSEFLSLVRVVAVCATKREKQRERFRG